MDFLGFTVSVWAAIALGVFFIALVSACTADRRHNESPKWIVLVLGAIVFLAWHYWVGEGLAWRRIFDPPFWKAVGMYAGIGVGYATVEFWFQIRREAREWRQAWTKFKNDSHHRTDSQQRIDARGFAHDSPSTETSDEERFALHVRGSFPRRITKMGIDEAKRLVPVLDKQELAESIGCWTALWPAYAVSLAFGDLFSEISRRLADLFAALSGRFVRKTFAKEFAP